MPFRSVNYSYNGAPPTESTSQDLEFIVKTGIGFFSDNPEFRLRRIGDTNYYDCEASLIRGDGIKEKATERVYIHNNQQFTFQTTRRNRYGKSFITFTFEKVKPTSRDYAEAQRKADEEAMERAQEELEAQVWSGSGFALKDGYVVTNNHVVDGAKTITVKGIRGNFDVAYSAGVVATDVSNDLALLKINDSRFTGFGAIPYAVKSTTSEVGEDCFVLGYPLTATMGDEIKYTNGVISSRTGFQGNASMYQISAPVQPGNSGGPLFDRRGNLIGVVSAKHSGAENVGYAIKSVQLRTFLESYIPSTSIPSATTTTSLSRPDQIKAIKKCVFYIECSKRPSSMTSSSE